MTSISPLAGGCAGGAQHDLNNAIVARGGGGGGAVQLVSLTSVSLSSSGLIDVGAGGGASTTGGGSGGLVIIEAPEVSLIGTEAGVVANGGSGGGCGLPGTDATVNATPAIAPTCLTYFAGNGGTASSAPGNGCRIGIDTCDSSCPVIYGGGGGSVGRLQITTKSGTFSAIGNPNIGASLTTTMLIAK